MSVKEPDFGANAAPPAISRVRPEKRAASRFPHSIVRYSLQLAVYYSGMSEEDREDRVRLDKWLWAARFYKTRALASAAIGGGKVQVNGDRAKRARPLQVGDELRIRQGVYEYQVTVRALAVRRGPAAEAAGLYQETDASRAARAAMALQLKTVHAAFIPERGRPTKKDRREINRVKGRE
jgi:ribosome-associated heat shock protein Hsp15